MMRCNGKFGIGAVILHLPPDMTLTEDSVIGVEPGNFPACCFDQAGKVRTRYK